VGPGTEDELLNPMGYGDAPAGIRGLEFAVFSRFR
jgi:hypothetical protein